ncbi:MAG TPA: hypothetical protein VNH18_14855 [Bryobacteraceae bacterium]|nr:hypothetical protein [Bryobacteraceae bacterium]
MQQLSNLGVRTMKWLFSVVILALSACATTTPRQHAPAGMSEARATVGTLTITGDDLKQTGRADLSDALRASSPIFH